MMDSELGSSGLFSWAIEHKEDELSCASPPLWRPGSSSYPMSTHTTYAYPYPMSARAEDIAKGRQELMKMVEGMPESAYELSLSDLVEQKAAMQKRANEEVDTETQKAEERSSGKQDRRKTSGSYINGSSKSKGENTKPFLLNIFIPKSLTHRPHSTSRSIPTSCCSQVKSHDSEKGSGNTYPCTNLYKIKASYSPTGSSIGFSKVSPKPFSAKDGQPFQALPASVIHTRYNFGFWKLSLSRCSLCCGYIFFSKTVCQACGKAYCKNCTKVHIEDTAEGQKCRDNCSGQPHIDRCYRVQSKRCLPFLAINREKHQAISGSPLEDHERHFTSI